MRISSACVLLLTAALPCQASVAAGSDTHSAAYARAPAYSHPALAPDGRFLSYVEQSGGSQRVVVRDLEGSRVRTYLDLKPPVERIRWCDWSGPQYLLCGTVLPRRSPQGVTEHTQLHVVDVDRGRSRLLNARLPAAIRDDVIDLALGDPDKVVIAYDAGGTGFPRVAELDVVTGDMRSVVPSFPPVRRWLTDGRGVVALGIGYDEGNAFLYVPTGIGSGWKLLSSLSLDDPELMGPLAFGATPAELFVLRHHRGRAALFRFDTTGGSEPELLHADPDFDVSGPVAVGPDGTLLRVTYLKDRETARTFDGTEAARQASLDGLLPDRVNRVLDRTLDGTQWLVESYGDIDPPTLWLFDIAASRLTRLLDQYPELEDAGLARMQAVSYVTRDGETVSGYLTLPPGTSGVELPFVILPHGGPETRDYWRFDPLVQFLAAEGYGVFQMNFRGSAGFGARYMAAGAGQWGGVIHNDITDGVRWLVDRGAADPRRICIVGSSFGGFAALLGAARESEWYACAASFAGISDLLAFSTHTRRLADADVWAERLGSDARALWQMSPLSRARTVETPILMIHGKLDAVVPVRQSARFARTLQAAGKEVEFAERVDCDHDMTGASCRLYFYERLAEFLRSHLVR